MVMLVILCLIIMVVPRMVQMVDMAVLLLHRVKVVIIVFLLHRFKVVMVVLLLMHLRSSSKSLDYVIAYLSLYRKVLFGQETCGGKVNWIRQRESVVCEAVIKEEVVSKVLKTTVLALVELNMLKNLMGYIMAVALGGFNAQASKIVSAVYLATLKDRV
ncbi:3-hydroxy-3-methylglutaryl coenzyme A reductase 2 [Tanacetum coccineum]